MKFVYRYRTSDNVRHEGCVKASSKDAAYTRLRAIGIRPIEVLEAPGFFNKLLGKYKRWMAIVFLSICVLGLSVLVNRHEEGDVLLKKDEYLPPLCDRCQIYGDPSILQEYRAKGWKGPLTNEVDLFLVRFAEPANKLQNISLDEIKVVASNLMAGVSYTEIDTTDIEEVKTMKRILNGIKLEFRDYIAEGGTPTLYIERLIERQKIESQIFEDAQREFRGLEVKAKAGGDRSSIVERWNANNKLLREMGMRSVPLPEELEY